MWCCFGATQGRNAAETGSAPAECANSMGLLKLAEGGSVRTGRNPSKATLATSTSLHKLPAGEFDRSVREGAAYLLGVGGVGGRTGSVTGAAERSVRGGQYGSVHGAYAYGGGSHHFASSALLAAEEGGRSVRGCRQYDQMGSADFAAVPASPPFAHASHVDSVAASAASLSMQRMAAAYLRNSMGGSGSGPQLLSKPPSMHSAVPQPVLVQPATSAHPDNSQMHSPAPASSSAAAAAIVTMVGSATAPSCAAVAGLLAPHTASGTMYPAASSYDDTVWGSLPTTSLQVSTTSSARTSPASGLTPPSSAANITGYGASSLPIATVAVAPGAAATVTTTGHVPSSMPMPSAALHASPARLTTGHRHSGTVGDDVRKSPSVRGWRDGSVLSATNVTISSMLPDMYSNPGVMRGAEAVSPLSDLKDLREDSEHNDDSEPLFLLALHHQTSMDKVPGSAAAAAPGGASAAGGHMHSRSSLLSSQAQVSMHGVASPALPDVCSSQGALPSLVLSGTPHASQANIIELESAAIAYEVAAMLGDLRRGHEEEELLKEGSPMTSPGGLPPSGTDHAQCHSLNAPGSSPSDLLPCMLPTCPVAIPIRSQAHGEISIRGGVLGRTISDDRALNDAALTLQRSSYGPGTPTTMPLAARRASLLGAGSVPKAALSSSLGVQVLGHGGGSCGGSVHGGGYFGGVSPRTRGGHGTSQSNVAGLVKSASVHGGSAFFTLGAQVTGVASRPCSVVGTTSLLSPVRARDGPSTHGGMLISGRGCVGPADTAVLGSPLLGNVLAVAGSAAAPGAGPLPAMSLDSMGRVRDESEVVALGFFARSVSALSGGGHSSNASTGQLLMCAGSQRASYNHLQSALQEVPEGRSGLSDISSSD